MPLPHSDRMPGTTGGVVVRIVGSVFRGRGRPGDFAWMIEQPDWADALFVFNDNEEQFRAYQRDPADPRACTRGGGNASIRPYRCAKPVRAAGVPTGVGGAGYRALTEAVRDVIDDAVSVVRAVAESEGYQRIVYSAADGSGGLGTGIFEVGDDVKAYIVEQLRRLENESSAADGH
jgi:hypothetical protein